jgi:hypothetical protein
MSAHLFFFFFSPDDTVPPPDGGETRRRRRGKRRRLVIERQKPERQKPEPIAGYYEPPVPDEPLAPIVPLRGGVQPSFVLPALPVREAYAAPLPDPSFLLGRPKARAGRGDKMRKLIALLMAMEAK